MALGNYTPYLPKQVTQIKFGSTAFTAANLASTTIALDASFTTNNATALIDLVGAPDTTSPTKSYDWAKDITLSGNEISPSDEFLLGANSVGGQNSEISYSGNAMFQVEATVLYRNIVPASLFNSTTTCCIMSMDNSESATTGALNIVFNNIRVIHVGSLQRNADGFMEQKIKFVCRGGEAAAATISCVQSSPSKTMVRIRNGLDYAEEIRTA